MCPTDISSRQCACTDNRSRQCAHTDISSRQCNLLTSEVVSVTVLTSGVGSMPVLTSKAGIVTVLTSSCFSVVALSATNRGAVQIIPRDRMCFLYKNEKEGLNRRSHMTDFSMLRANDSGTLEGRSGLCAYVMSTGGQ